MSGKIKHCPDSSQGSICQSEEEIFEESEYDEFHNIVTELKGPGSKPKMKKRLEKSKSKMK